MMVHFTKWGGRETQLQTLARAKVDTNMCSFKIANTATIILAGEGTRGVVNRGNGPNLHLS